jgi:tRNA (cmo5U34)-methyltransferase
MPGDQRHSVKRHLDVGANDYDLHIRRLIPYYDELISAGVDVLAALVPGEGHVLDLGGGTGALSAAVLDRLPGVLVTVLDVDPDILSEARRRLERFSDRVSFREGSFLGPLPAADAVVASLALHHVHDLQTKIELYGAIRDTLPPGGALLNLDAAVTEDPRLNRLVFDRMATRMRDHGIGVLPVAVDGSGRDVL